MPVRRRSGAKRWPRWPRRACLLAAVIAGTRFARCACAGGRGLLPALETRSLAGSYLVHCRSEEDVLRWTLYSLRELPSKAEFKSEGAHAWASLMTTRGSEVRDGSMSLDAQVNFEEKKVSITQRGSAMPAELAPLLCRVLAQHAVQHAAQRAQRAPWWVQLEGEEIPLDLSMEGIGRFFNTSGEIVEMVDREGQLLGFVPRQLVHQQNLLHRGIGLFVTAEQPISEQPEVYVHRRSDSKRIFPSLYDMFVGGISTAGEEPRRTAWREVAEELGLTKEEHLSLRLLRCAVCTAYNRCVVDLFSYTMDLKSEMITWQADEVAWGAFVPYAQVEASADRSMARLEAIQAWPGQSPALQSPRRGEISVETCQAVTSSSGETWEDWDFVPDGLLVWEAWLRSERSGGKEAALTRSDGFDKFRNVIDDLPLLLSEVNRDPELQRLMAKEHLSSIDKAWLAKNYDVPRPAKIVLFISGAAALRKLRPIDEATELEQQIEERLT
ncbi:Uncharacterized Nudix hydrolase orf19 [Durusdinium trenchii]|uniref:Uncharacterized Nudix hydrolase orf19 n=1 Tax=Durusdinium trenchii TaxID=1381693 RepID=A0ABP0IFF2_9DINO